MKESKENLHKIIKKKSAFITDEMDLRKVRIFQNLHNSDNDEEITINVREFDGIRRFSMQ